MFKTGQCSSEETIENDVTSATSGNAFSMTVTEVAATGASEMTRMSESGSETTDEATGTSSATPFATEQTGTTTVDPTNSVATVSNSFMTTTELNTVTTEEDTASATSNFWTTVATVVGNDATNDNNDTTDATVTATSVVPQSIGSATTLSAATETFVSAVTNEEHKTGSESVTWSSSESSMTTDNYTAPFYTAALQSTIRENGSSTDEDVTTSDVTKSHANWSDVTPSQVNTSDATTSNVTNFFPTSSDVSASNVTMTSQSSDYPATQHSGSKYSTTDIIIIVVVTVVGGLIIISALVAVVWRLRLYRNLSRYFLSNGHAQEFDMAASTSADGKKSTQTESDIGVLADEAYQPQQAPNCMLKIIHEPDLHDQPLFLNADQKASESKANPSAMVEVPLNDGIRNHGFQGDSICQRF